MVAPSKFSTPKSSLRCLQINLRHSKLASLSLSQILLDFDIDIALLQEPYALTADPPQIANIPPGYSSHHLLSKNDHAFGAAILTRDSSIPRATSLLPLSNNFTAGIEISTKSGSIKLFSVYLRPSLPNFEAVIEQLFSSETNSLSLFSMDANAHNQLWFSPTTDSRGEELELAVHRRNLNIANIEKADLEFKPAATTFVDLTVHGDLIKLSNWRFLPLPSLSDHPFIYFEILTTITKSPKKRGSNSEKVPKLTNINKQRYLSLLPLELNTHSPTISHPSVPNILVEIEQISAAIVKCAKAAALPVVRKTANRSMPWWSRELCALRTKARKAYKTWSISRYDHDKQISRSCSAVYQREIRRAKSLAWQEIRKNSSPTELFAAIKSASGKSKSTRAPAFLTINDQKITNPTDILMHCANHFFPITTTSEPCHRRTEHLVTEHLAKPDHISIPPIAEWEFEKAVSSLNPKAAAGSDNVSAGLLLLSMPLIRARLLLVFDACLSLCYFPTPWKSVKVSILGKQNKQDYSLLQSLRPISLISNFSKLLENILLNRLNWFASSRNWLSQNQHGFREGKSTESATLSLVSFIENGFSGKLYTASAFLDIKSAFDSAWHPAIIAMLIKRKCPHYLCSIVSSFLAERTATLAANDASLERPVTLGCPQGGVLSPLLWNLLVDDIIRSSFPFHVHTTGYADDINLATQHKDPGMATNQLQTAVERVSQKFSEVKLSLNASKTVFMLFSKKRIPVSHLSLSIGDLKISPSQQTTFLGLLIDSNLKWLPHLIHKCSAAKRALFSISCCLRLTWGFDKNRLRFLYQAAIEPIVSYNCAVWISVLRTKNGKRKARSFQRQISLLLTKAFKSAPNDALLVLSNLLPIDLIFTELAAFRFLSKRESETFPSSSISFITSVFPDILSIPSPNQTSKPVYPSIPPWSYNIKIHRLSSLDPISLNSGREGYVRIYPIVSPSKNREGYGYGIVAADHDSVKSIANLTLPPCIDRHQANSLAINEALKLATDLSASYTRLEIFLTSLSSLSFALSSRRLDQTDASSLLLLLNIQSQADIFYGIDPEAEGPKLASFWAMEPIQTIQPIQSLAFSYSPMPISPTFSNKAIRAKIRSHSLPKWNTVWQTSHTGAITRLFFPDIYSTNILRGRDIDHLTIQILTGHSRLNGHLHRMKLIQHPACLCGAPIETVQHFLFSCPIFNPQRTDFTLATTDWPPSLSAISQSETLWTIMIKFIKQSRRLAKPQINS